MFFGCAVISDLYLYQEVILLNLCFVFSIDLLLPFIGKVTKETWSLVLFILNITPVVCVASIYPLQVFLNISEIAQFFDHVKASFISQLFKSRNLQKLLKYFYRTTTATSNLLLSFRVLPIIFVLYSNDSLVIVLLIFIP